MISTKDQREESTLLQKHVFPASQLQEDANHVSGDSAKGSPYYGKGGKGGKGGDYEYGYEPEPTPAPTPEPFIPKQQAVRFPVQNYTRLEEYIQGMFAMKSTKSVFFDDLSVSPRFRNLTWYEVFTVIHGTNFPQNSFAHEGVAFGTWHRLLMLLFEWSLNIATTNQATPLAIPFWDWVIPESTAALYNAFGGDGNKFDDSCIPGPFAYPNFNITIKNNFYPENIKKYQCLTRAISQEGTTQTDLMMGSHLPTMPDVTRGLVAQRYDNQPYDISAMGAMSFRNILEGYGAEDNTGTNLVHEGHEFHGFHNIVHLDVGETMATLVSDNDPIFWTHHCNIDRYLQTWLVQSGALYGTGNTRKEGDTPLTKGYPAQLVKVDRECLGKDYKITISDDVLPAFGVEWTFGDGSTGDFATFLKCSYARDPSGNQVVGGNSYGKRILLGFPAQNKLAAFMPSIPELFTDPFVFEARNVGGKDIRYEEHILTIKPKKAANSTEHEKFVISALNIFDKDLSFGLLTPSWFNRENRVNTTLGDKLLHSPFGTRALPGLDFKALAVTHGGWYKMDLEDYSPDHYAMWGYIEAIKDTPLTLTFNGQVLSPIQSCFNSIPGLERFGCKTNSTAQPPESQTPTQSGIFNGRATTTGFTDPFSNSTALVEISGAECLTLAEMQLQGYIINMSAAKEMRPVDKKFCIVSGHFIGDREQSTEEHLQNWHQNMGSDQVMWPIGELSSVDLSAFNGASLTFGPWPKNQNRDKEPRGFTQGMDVTDYIYTGARPGGNFQDVLHPFDELGFKYSPAFFFDESTANYSYLYEVAGQ